MGKHGDLHGGARTRSLFICGRGVKPTSENRDRKKRRERRAAAAAALEDGEVRGWVIERTGEARNEVP
jgi:hypothetical protein